MRRGVARWLLAAAFAAVLLPGCEKPVAPENAVSGPVTASVVLTDRAIKPGSTTTIAVELHVKAPFEIYGWETRPPGFPTRAELRLPPKFEAIDDWQWPETVRSIAPSGHSVYVNKVVFTRQVKVADDTPAGTYEIFCDVAFQACTHEKCLQPSRMTLAATLTIDR